MAGFLSTGVVSFAQPRYPQAVIQAFPLGNKAGLCRIRDGAQACYACRRGRFAEVDARGARLRQTPGERKGADKVCAHERRRGAGISLDPTTELGNSFLELPQIQLAD